VNAWFHRDLTGLVRDTLASPVPIDITPQAPFIPASDEEEDILPMRCIESPSPVAEDPIRWMMVDPIFRNLMSNTGASLTIATPDRAEHQAMYTSRRSSVGVSRPVRQEPNAVSHHRTPSAGYHVLCPSCGRIHGPTQGPTIIIFQPLSRRAFCFYLFFLFCQFVLFYLCSRMSVKG
jgi:hypothetical protein